MINRQDKKNKKKSAGAWYYLAVVLIIYLLVAAFRFDMFESAIVFFWQLTIRIFPIFILVFVLMTIANILMTPHFIQRNLQKAGARKWLFVVCGGILSTGPIFMWYPFLSDLKNKGMGYGPLATFLYNRAIKIPLLPVAIYYFGWRFVLILTIVMVTVSVLQGIIIDRLIPCEL